MELRRTRSCGELPDTADRPQPPRLRHSPSGASTVAGVILIIVLPLFYAIFYCVFLSRRCSAIMGHADPEVAEVVTEGEPSRVPA